jgi:hypothetical protein
MSGSVMPDKTEEELIEEICVCGHGAGWHFLAWLSWRRGEQTDSWCTYEEEQCVCSSFVKASDGG